MCHKHVNLAGQVSTFKLLKVNFFEWRSMLEPLGVGDGRGGVTV
jgi:hypothetical protein